MKESERMNYVLTDSTLERVSITHPLGHLAPSRRHHRKPSKTTVAGVASEQPESLTTVASRHLPVAEVSLTCRGAVRDVSRPVPHTLRKRKLQTTRHPAKIIFNAPSESTVDSQLFTGESQVSPGESEPSLGGPEVSHAESKASPSESGSLPTFHSPHQLKRKSLQRCLRLFRGC